MNEIPVIVQCVIFVILVVAYVKLCTNREVGIIGKWVEIVSLYGVSALALLGNLKFIVWAAGIFLIGLIKFLTTTKKQKVERRI